MTDTVMTYTLEASKRIPIANISVGERFYEPTPKQISIMAASLKAFGQLMPITVHHGGGRNSWRIVAGGTRLKAAFELGWTHIRADIISGHAIDYRIIELVENAERRNLTAAQRKQAKAELKKLMREKLANTKAAKGGRGNKGGVAEAARQMGVPRSTAQDVMTRHAKPAGNTSSRQVSEPKPNGGDPAVAPSPAVAAAAPTPTPSLALENMVSPISIRMTVGERTRVERYNVERCGKGSMSDCMRKLIRNALAAENY